jgi:predicted DCC family thiol-disulfide oxidoreductase YuxK
MRYLIIYDGDCNLCTGLVRLLESLERGQVFAYRPMQDEQFLGQYGLTPADIAQGVMLIDMNSPHCRWQGTSALEEIASLLPAGAPFVHLYRQIKPLNWLGDRTYEQIRDHRYALFGKRSRTFFSQYAPPSCGDRCQLFLGAKALP